MIDRKQLKVKVIKLECDKACHIYFGCDLDTLILGNTGFKSFDDLLTAKGSYRPTCQVVHFPHLIIADSYDRLQEARGDDRRAFRSGNQPQMGEVYKDPYTSHKNKWCARFPWGVEHRSTKKALTAFIKEALEEMPLIFNKTDPMLKKKFMGSYKGVQCQN